MKLLTGITGFFYSPDNEPPNIDGKQFKKICFTIIQQCNGEIIDFKEPDFTNYFVVEAKAFNIKFYILLNAHYPIITFASSVEKGHLIFIDVPSIARLFSPFYTVLVSKELNEPPLINPNTKVKLSRYGYELNSAEMENLAYWKPERMGEIILNCWD